MDPIYIVIMTLVLSLVVIFFGTTYYDQIMTGFNQSDVVEVFYYWLLILSIFSIVTFAFAMYFYVTIRNKRGPPGPRGERGKNALISADGFTKYV